MAHPLESFDLIRAAFRWTYYTQWSHLIDMSDVVPTLADYDAIPSYQSPRNATIVRDVLVGGSDLVKLNMSKLRTGPEAGAAELGALRRAVCGMIVYFMIGRDPGPTVGLRIELGATRTTVRSDAVESGATLTLGEGAAVSLHWAGQVIKRNSKLVHRLGRLLFAGA